MDRLAQAYGSTDWSAVAAFVASNPLDAGNPNIMFIPLSLGNVYLNRYEAGKDIADLERATTWFEWVTERHGLWGRRWLAGSVVGYLDISLVRLRGQCPPAADRDRIEAVWRRALAITEEEADGRLTGALPYRPYDSSNTGDSKGEEDAWEAGALAAAANFLPDHPRAPAWDRKARQIAYDAITAPADPPDLEGLKTATVDQDFGLGNHGLFPNPTYMGATIALLAQGALTYRLSGRDVPPEFEHNMAALYGSYRRLVDSDLEWIVPADPSGRASLFPFAFDPDLEDRAVRCEREAGLLWLATRPVIKMEVGEPLWTAILNSKVVLFYLMGSYLWHFPPAAGCGPDSQRRE